MPTIASRTPEGDPLRCPLCGEVSIDVSLPAGDVPCPTCGQLLWYFRHGENVYLLDRQRLPGTVERLLPYLKAHFGWPSESGDLGKRGKDSKGGFGLDSLDWVEIAMDLEEEFDLNIPDDVATGIHSLEDLIRYFLEKSAEESE